MNLKTAEQRAAEIRAESAAIEEAKAADKAERAEKLGKKEVVIEANEPDYKALAKAEEQHAAKLKAEVDALQAEMDPSLNKPKKETPHVVLTELLNRHDNAEDALNALHEAIRKMREEPGLNEKPPAVFPSDLSHLTEKQRAKTLAEMEAGRQASERAKATVARMKEFHAELQAKKDGQQQTLERLQAELAKANETIAVLRHNPSVNEVFPTTPANKVASAGI